VIFRGACCLDEHAFSRQIAFSTLHPNRQQYSRIIDWSFYKILYEYLSILYKIILVIYQSKKKKPDLHSEIRVLSFRLGCTEGRYWETVQTQQGTHHSHFTCRKVIRFPCFRTFYTAGPNLLGK
jgi:hypothetical protein